MSGNLNIYFEKLNLLLLWHFLSQFYVLFETLFNLLCLMYFWGVYLFSKTKNSEKNDIVLHFCKSVVSDLIGGSWILIFAFPHISSIAFGKGVTLQIWISPFIKWKDWTGHPLGSFKFWDSDICINSGWIQQSDHSPWEALFTWSDLCYSYSAHKAHANSPHLFHPGKGDLSQSGMNYKIFLAVTSE